MRDALNPITPADRWTEDASTLLAHALVEQAGELRRYLHDVPPTMHNRARRDWICDEIPRLESAARVMLGTKP